MIDLHAHILWDIDDGSKEQAMSLKMLEIAAQSGTEAIFATPHVIEKHAKPSWETIKEKTQQLQELALDEGINIKIYPGAEVQMNWELLSELGVEGAYCLDGSKYLLMELPGAEIPNYADEFCYELELKGITPILAHPERYHRLNNNFELLLRWRRSGMLLQCNSGSFTGMFGEAVAANAEVFLQNGLIDFLGSDAHRSERRNTDMSGAIAAIRRLTEDESVIQRIMVQNPKTLLMNGDIEFEMVETIKARKPARGLWQKIFGK